MASPLEEESQFQHTVSLEASWQNAEKKGGPNGQETERLKGESPDAASRLLSRKWEAAKGARRATGAISRAPLWRDLRTCSNAGLVELSEISSPSS